MSGRRVLEIWAYLAVDPSDDSEGIVGRLAPSGQWVPFVGADIERMAELRPQAEEIAFVGQVVVRLANFSERLDVETIDWNNPRRSS